MKFLSRTEIISTPNSLSKIFLMIASTDLLYPHFTWYASARVVHWHDCSRRRSLRHHYILRSKSDLPVVAQNYDFLHKIGVTGGSVQKRIANAKLDPTFLMADVEVVTTYELYNINRVKLENLLHRVFEAERLDTEIMDRFGHPVPPRECFLVPLFAIDDGSWADQGSIDSKHGLRSWNCQATLVSNHLIGLYGRLYDLHIYT